MIDSKLPFNHSCVDSSKGNRIFLGDYFAVSLHLLLKLSSGIDSVVFSHCLTHHRYNTPNANHLAHMRLFFFLNSLFHQRTLSQLIFPLVFQLPTHSMLALPIRGYCRNYIRSHLQLLANLSIPYNMKRESLNYLNIVKYD